MNIEPFTFSTLIPQGYKILSAEPGEAEYRHALFGPNRIHGGDCPNCRKPLLHLLTIDTRDPRLDLGRLPLARIPLLYCTRCAISWADGDVNIDGLRQHCPKGASTFSGIGCDFHYHIQSEDQVKILVFNMGYEEEYVPYPNYPDYFPGSLVKLIPINDEELWYCQRMNRYWEEHPVEYERADYEAIYAFQTQYDYLNHWTHQLGGEPCFWNEPGPLACPCCGADMPFLAMIEDNESAGTPALTREGFQIIFFFCPACSIIGVYVIGT